MPLVDLQLKEDSEVIITIVEVPELSNHQMSDERETAEREKLIRQIMAHAGCTRADVEHLFETQWVWFNDHELEEIIGETQKGFEKWHIEEW